MDDEPALRKTILASLAATGFTVEEAGTGSEAVSAVRRRPFDLMLMDVNMPGMTGVEACRQIRAFAPRTGIIMVTVRDTEDDKVQALKPVRTLCNQAFSLAGTMCYAELHSPAHRSCVITPMSAMTPRRP